jgi:6-pyruvoyltetrahydropterin/6-carboxytetrahydropterin synthase
MIYLTFAYEFNAVHRLRNPGLGDRENLEIFGKCSHPSGHGHGYRVEVTVAGEVSKDDPSVLGESEIKALKAGVLDRKLAYSDLNEVFGDDFISSGENIARKVAEMLVPELDGKAGLVAVRIIETRKNSFLYCMETHDVEGGLHFHMTA